MNISKQVITHFKLNEAETELTYGFRGYSELHTASILSKTVQDGCLTELILDRLIHKPTEDAFDVYENDKYSFTFKVYGSIATEINISHRAGKVA
jgi:hypothetical protein